MMEENKYQNQYKRLKLLDIKKYVELFPQNIRSNASLLEVSKKLQSFKELDKNTYEATISGAHDYVVKILLDDDLALKNCGCECAYYKNTDHHCKHVYALLNKIIEEKNNIIIQNKFDENITNLGQELDKLNLIMEKNKLKNNKSFLGNWSNSILEQMSEDYNNMKEIKLSEMTFRDSYYTLNKSLSLLEEARKNIKEIKEEIKKYYKEKKSENDVVTASYTLDDSKFFEEIDKFMENVDLEVLNKAREKQINDGNYDTEVIDRAIKKQIKKKEQIEKQRKKEAKAIRKAMFWGFVNGLFGSFNSSKNYSNNNELMDWEKDAMKNGNYEPFNFEEQELEDDDYYNDDLD